MRTSKIHEEVVKATNQFRNDWLSGKYGTQGWPGPTGIHYKEGLKLRYICIEDSSYRENFDVCSVFKDVVYEGKIDGDKIIIYELGQNYSIGYFDRKNFYSIAEMRDKKIDELLGPEGNI